jgi:acetyl/propionyl-CoA carboxylase alpha subunit
MTFKKILIANRGEIALRIARAASEMDVATVSVYSTDDAASLHAGCAGESVALPGRGAAAYLSFDDVLQAAHHTGCDAIHPGYGFLAENASFARRAAAEGIVFIGPSPETLALFGDKAEALHLAKSCDVPIIEGLDGAPSQPQAAAFLASLGPSGAIMVKAIAGGGGRGMRIVRHPDELAEAWERCRSEARTAFGNEALYVERYLPSVRHIEVQIVGDGEQVVHFGERECTIQRRHQKIVEIAPSPGLRSGLRDAICAAALRMARKVSYRGLGTFEFLVPTDASSDDFVFIEANPRVQVEHTVTEEVFGIDLLKTQIRIAAGACLAELGLDLPCSARGAAIQLRINMETYMPDGSAKPTGGTLTAFDLPSGPGIRIDTFGYRGYQTNPHYDSLLAKVVAFSPEGLTDAIRRARRALSDFQIDGVATNIPVLRAILSDPDFVGDRISTSFFESRIGPLLDAAGAFKSKRSAAQMTATVARNPTDPLGVFDASVAMKLPDPSRISIDADKSRELLTSVRAPLQGTVISCDMKSGEAVRAGQQILVIESMKMEHPIVSPVSGIIDDIVVLLGDTLFEGDPILWIAPVGLDEAEVEQDVAIDLDAIRSDLAESIARHADLSDEHRPDAVARRRKTGQRTARENVADICDPATFIEYGGLAVAAQRQRRSIQELRRISPADGMITGIGSVNGALFDESQSRCAIMAYDYTVFAGTQGAINHKKKDRLLTLANKWSLPVVLFAEGGGGRPGDEWPTPAALDTTTFLRFGELNGKVPTIGIVSGRCFAGNAALLGSCDVIIADKTANIGMGGPAMIEGGGLGVFRPEDIGPVEVQTANGVIDITVEDEVKGVSAAKRYLSYFQGRLNDWSCADQRLLRQSVPENRLRAYDIRAVIDVLADSDSVLELRPLFGPGMITALIRIEGRPVGLIANNSRHLGGAIDANGADKAARFIQLCDGFDIPVVSLCDTPGMMVGPEVEKTAQVRHVSRMFVAAARATIPFFTVVLRKGYGLGAIAMAAGSSQAPFFVVAWPSAEFGAMGLEGAVKLAYRKELAAIDDATQRKAWFDDRVARSYQDNKALNSATFLEVDDVIDPRDTRFWIARGLKSVPQPQPLGARKGTRVDVW